MISKRQINGIQQYTNCIPDGGKFSLPRENEQPKGACRRDVWEGPSVFPEYPANKNIVPTPPLVAFASRRSRPFYCCVAIDKLMSRRWIIHCLVLEARQQNLRFYDSAKCLEFFNRLVFRQATTGLAIFLLTAWGRHSLCWWCGADTRGALSLDHVGMCSVLI